MCSRLVAVIRGAAEQAPEGKVLLCSPIGEPHFFHKLSYGDLEEAVLPDRHTLDEATTTHPVVIMAGPPVRPGVMACNSAGLELLEVSADTTDDRLRFKGMTLAWDGYCFGGTMMMREPYLDVYGKLTHGHRHISPERAEYVMRFCAERGMRLNILAMGVMAHDEVLELLERLDPEIDVAAQNWILCHATTIENAQIDRYKALNFSHTTSMAFGCGEGDLMCRTMGRHVLDHMHPLRHFFDAHMAVGAGTDWGPLSPWAQIELSLTHELTESGRRNLGAN